MIYHGTITMENGAELPFELYPEDAPRTVENFVKLVKEGYYDGKTFHRVIKNFVSQGGCPYGTDASVCMLSTASASRRLFFLSDYSIFIE